MMLTTTTRLRFISWLAVFTTLLASLLFAQPAASQGVPKPPSPESAGEYTITITSWRCDSGVAIDPYDADDLAANCTTPMDGMQFWLFSVPTGTVNGITQGGVVQFAPPPDRAWYVKQRPLDGYAVPSAHCVLLDADGAVVADLDTLQVADSVYFDFDRLRGGNQIACDWYVIRDHEDRSGEGSLTIFKWTCPDGYDPAAAGADPFNDCREGPDGVHFELDDIVETGEVMDNAVTFTGIAPGTYPVAESVPDGNGSFFVWQGCVDPPDPSLPAFTPAVPASDLAAIAHRADGTDRLCHWFNVPEGDDDAATTGMARGDRSATPRRLR